MPRLGHFLFKANKFLPLGLSCGHIFNSLSFRTNQRGKSVLGMRRNLIRQVSIVQNQAYRIRFLTLSLLFPALQGFEMTNCVY